MAKTSPAVPEAAPAPARRARSPRRSGRAPAAQAHPGDLDQFAVGLVETARSLTRAAARSAGPGERRALTGAQMDVLVYVARHPDQTVTELAERLQLARNTVSTLIGQLTKAGLILRSGDPDDARVTRLSLTPEAAERMAGWRARRVTAVRDALAALDPADLAAVTAALQPLQAVVSALEEAGPDSRLTLLSGRDGV